MNPAQRRIMLGAVAIFLTVAALVMVANAESTHADLTSAGVTIPRHLIWSWEWTSLIAWFSLFPLLWLAVRRLRPPRVSWPVAGIAFALGSVIASAWHIGVMIVLRQLYYAAVGAGPYRFFGVIGDRILYEYRKDLVTYVQFVALCAVVQWLVARAATPVAAAAPTEPPARTISVSEGTATHLIPVNEIERVGSAGNYVEIDWLGRTLLHRATLTAIEGELGAAFVRIHRGQIVRRDAVRRVDVDRSGDFTVTLASGTEVQGSRRYRAALS